METAGIAMLAAVAVLLLATGLPAWIVLVGVAFVASCVGIAAGVFSVSLLEGLPSRLLGLFENDLLQALPLYVLMGAMLNRLPLADTLFRVLGAALARTRAGAPLAGFVLGALLAPMNGSVGASIATLSRTVYPRLRAAGVPEVDAEAQVCVASTLGVVVPPSLVLILLGDAMLRAHTEAVNITHQAVRIVNTQDVFRGALVPAALLFALYRRRRRIERPPRRRGPAGGCPGRAATGRGRDDSRHVRAHRRTPRRRHPGLSLRRRGRSDRRRRAVRLRHGDAGDVARGPRGDPARHDGHFRRAVRAARRSRRYSRCSCARSAPTAISPPR